MSKPRIFTFWEPKDHIPGYIRLCMKTWERFLPDYEVTLLDYATLPEYLTPEEIESFVDRRMSLAMQADCIRCVLLEKWGGIWMDADTIITDGSCLERLLKEDASVICNLKSGNCFGAFLYAARPHAEFYSRWRAELAPRLCTLRRLRRWSLFRAFFRKKWKFVRNWDYCLNGIIDPLAAELRPPKLCVVKEEDMTPMPERAGEIGNDSSLSVKEKYRLFWFEKRDLPADVMAQNAGLIFLHNGWTPETYKSMSEDEFLATDCTLSRLLSGILKQDK